jgi:DNA gyrase subunit A
MSNTIDIREELGRNFLTYALDVDQNKAFPSVADGLAPGARAALWEMYVSKYFSNKPHIKSAKVAAGVIGRWWTMKGPPPE